MSPFSRLFFVPADGEGMALTASSAERDLKEVASPQQVLLALIFFVQFLQPHLIGYVWLAYTQFDCAKFIIQCQQISIESIESWNFANDGRCHVNRILWFEG